MKNIKRVEVIIGKRGSEKVVELLHKNEIKGYSRIRNVDGAGDKFSRDGEYPTDVFTNHYVLIGCSPEDFNKIKEPLRQLLEEYSGVCMVSDAQWLIH